MSEAHGQAFCFERDEVGGIVVTGDGQMLSGRLEILSDRHNVAIDGPQVAHDVAGFIEALSHSQDQAGFGRHSLPLGLAEQVDRSLILALRPERWKQPPDRFNVVIQNLRFLSADRRKCRVLSFEIRNQDFNCAAGTQGSCLPDGFGKDRCAIVRQLVAIDRRDDGMTKAERLHGLSHPLRLTVIDRERPPRLYGAVVAASGADVSEDQEGGRTGVPAFPPIRTARFFADGVELEPVHGLLDVEIIGTGSCSDFEPCGQARSADR